MLLWAAILTSIPRGLFKTPHDILRLQWIAYLGKSLADEEEATPQKFKGLNLASLHSLSARPGHICISGYLNNQRKPAHHSKIELKWIRQPQVVLYDGFCFDAPSRSTSPASQWLLLTCTSLNLDWQRPLASGKKRAHMTIQCSSSHLPSLLFPCAKYIKPPQLCTPPN